ncbi:MFS transporter [Paenibacillus sp. LMG 31458]|uniref:MFS transporter n=1 Tax=Paenibacillus phytorum TaxID=2654977 RepID=A0ABX1Y4P3_9BACL|nr:MFS transporter [Paenibacillus phytorum]NOU75731.1 MFS transporter [Paenibacillus phytorum]
MPKDKSVKSVPLWTKDFILLSLSNMLLFLGFQMLLPTLPVFVSENGGSSTQVGLVIGLLTLSAIVIRPFAGMALDMLGRKIVLVIGSLICIAAMGGFIASATVFVVLFIRFIHGIGWGISTTSYGVIASDIIPAARRGEGMGYFGLGSTLAMALGPLAGIWIMNNFGYTLLFICCFVSTILSFVCTQFVTLPQLSKATKAQVGSANSVWSKLIEKQALFPSLLVLLLGVTYGGIVSFITLFSKETGIENVGLFFLINALSVFVIRPVSGRIFDRYGHFWIIFPGALFSIAGLLLLSLATTTGLMICAAACYGIGFGSVQPTLQAWTINRIAPHQRGAANATFYSAFDLGIGGGGMLLGTVAGVSSYAQMYRYSVVFLAIYIVLYLLYMAKQPKKQEKKPIHSGNKI